MYMYMYMYMQHGMPNDHCTILFSPPRLLGSLVKCSVGWVREGCSLPRHGDFFNFKFRMGQFQPSFFIFLPFLMKSRTGRSFFSFHGTRTPIVIQRSMSKYNSDKIGNGKNPSTDAFPKTSGVFRWRSTTFSVRHPQRVFYHFRSYQSYHSVYRRAYRQRKKFSDPVFTKKLKIRIRIRINFKNCHYLTKYHVM